MITTFTCASCGATNPAPHTQVGAIAVCPDCGASSVVDVDGETRRATGADTTGLSAAGLQALRTARGRIARPDRRQS